MKTFIVISISIFLFVLGCTDNEIELIDTTYILENDTEFTVNIKFFNKIDNSLNTETSSILNIKGDRLSQEIKKTDNFQEGLPASVFVADSVMVVINGDKFFSYTYDFDSEIFSEPINGNLFRHSNYEHLGNEKYLFKITQQDYENAEDCNGNCD